MYKEKYYIYAYLDPRKSGNYQYGDINLIFEPFYVGKGSGYRFKSHINKAIKKKLNTPILNKIRSIIKENLIPEITFLKYFKNEEDAYDYEEYIINLIGRKDLNEGTLTNLKDGGGVGYNLSKEIRNKIGKYHIGKKLSLDHIECIRKANLNNKHNLGKVNSKETNLKKGHKGEKNPNAKLTKNNVMEIRGKYKTGNYYQKDLGKEYGVSKGTIYRIINNKIWNIN